ncbi:MAG: hypothetical protein IPP31_10455 [Chitinophagaceae bacterium]|nr:hypothetical protein [Chitinophagaceae bacterium]
MGGGTGNIIKPNTWHLMGILFDMESAGDQHVLSDFVQRVQFVSGVFRSYSGSRLLILKTVILDWNDENAQKILSNCRNALLFQVVK